ncbi:MAG: DUF3299 domain-containing protein [Balneolaceae bacterium]|nr:DUF3299 domain-containing protein [Balneolaceae bacterium]
MKNKVCTILFLTAFILVLSTPIFAQNIPNAVTWDVLKKVKWEIDSNRGTYIPNFDQEVEKLDGKEITVKGYLYPLGYGSENPEFLFTPYPVNGCFYCVPGSAETMIHLPETKLEKVPLTRVTVKGKFHLLRDSPYGLIYKITDTKIDV